MLCGLHQLDNLPQREHIPTSLLGVWVIVKLILTDVQGLREGGSLTKCLEAARRCQTGVWSAHRKARVQHGMGTSSVVHIWGGRLEQTRSTSTKLLPFDCRSTIWRRMVVLVSPPQQLHSLALHKIQRMHTSVWCNAGWTPLFTAKAFMKLRSPSSSGVLLENN